MLRELHLASCETCLSGQAGGSLKCKWESCLYRRVCSMYGRVKRRSRYLQIPCCPQQPTGLTLTVNGCVCFHYYLLLLLSADYGATVLVSETGNYFESNVGAIHICVSVLFINLRYDNKKSVSGNFKNTLQLFTFENLREVAVFCRNERKITSQIHMPADAFQLERNMLSHLRSKCFTYLALSGVLLPGGQFVAVYCSSYAHFKNFREIDNKLTDPILNKKQEGRPTEQAIYSFPEKILTYFDKRQFSTGIFADLSKTFDCVDHNIFFTNLNKQITNGSCIMFADDTNILVTSLNNAVLEENVKQTVTDMSSWFQYNKLTLNVNKYVLMSFMQRNKHTTQDERWTIIEYRLIHVDSVCKKLSSMCFAVHTLKNICDNNTILAYYFSNIQSMINYGIIFWGKSTKCKKAFRLQKKIANRSCAMFFQSTSTTLLMSLSQRSGGLPLDLSRSLGIQSITAVVHLSSLLRAVCPAHCHFRVFILSRMSLTNVHAGYIKDSIPVKMAEHISSQHYDQQMTEPHHQSLLYFMCYFINPPPPRHPTTQPLPSPTNH
ncbi:hypothetical protein PR048_026512 [Dryococelus australis]|uniref:Reverse transcriptase domain-containing protein n=1 Tax=Dryococelus australis TaxID=614101 RepID=A0ABQ9GLI5_9NEOP|nr:hypothetical protein PR048_026512 [Dryococelus australis]